MNHLLNKAKQRIIKDAGIHNENAATMQSKRKVPFRLNPKVLFDLLKLYDAIPFSLSLLMFSLFLNRNKAKTYNNAVKLPTNIKL